MEKASREGGERKGRELTDGKNKLEKKRFKRDGEETKLYLNG